MAARPLADRPVAERLALTVLAVLGTAWAVGMIVDREIYFQPILFGLGTGTIICLLYTSDAADE